MGKQRAHHLHPGLKERLFVQILPAEDISQRSGLSGIREPRGDSCERHLPEELLVKRLCCLQPLRTEPEHNRFQYDHLMVIADLCLIKLLKYFCQRIVFQRFGNIFGSSLTESFLCIPESVSDQAFFSIARCIFIVLILFHQAVHLLCDLNRFPLCDGHADLQKLLRCGHSGLRSRNQKLLRRLRVIESVSLLFLRFFFGISLKLLNQDLFLIGGPLHQLCHGSDTPVKFRPFRIMGKPEQHIQSGAALLFFFI